jgi:hypothetical protein
VFLVAFVGDVVADVVEERGGSEERALLARQFVCGGQTVEDDFGEPRHLLRVRLFVAEASPDGVCAAQARIGHVGHGRACFRSPRAQPFDDDAFAQSEIAGAQDDETERRHHAFENLSARDDDLRALCAQARHAAPLGGGQLREFLIEPGEFAQANLRARRLRTLQLVRVALLRALAQQFAEREDRAGRAGHVRPTLRAQFTRRSFERRADLLAQCAQFFRFDGIAREHAFGETDRAELERIERERQTRAHQ